MGHFWNRVSSPFCPYMGFLAISWCQVHNGSSHSLESFGFFSFSSSLPHTYLVIKPCTRPSDSSATIPILHHIQLSWLLKAPAMASSSVPLCPFSPYSTARGPWWAHHSCAICSSLVSQCPRMTPRLQEVALRPLGQLFLPCLSSLLSPALEGRCPDIFLWSPVGPLPFPHLVNASLMS